MRAGHRPATAVLVAALVALTAACGADSDPTTAPTSTAPTSSASSGTTAPPATTTDQANAMAAVDAWIASIGTGDMAAIENGLGPTSRGAIQQMGGLATLMSGLAEGMANFGLGDMQRSAVPVPDHEGAWLVTYQGEVSAEGLTGYDAQSWLVVPGDDGAKVETLSWPLPEVLAPADPYATTEAETVTVTLPAGGTVLTVLDGTTALPGPLVEGIDGDQVQISAAPEDGLPSGQHAITVAVVPEAGNDGPWATTAVALDVG